MSVQLFDDEILISFLSQPTPQFNSLQKGFLHKERVLMTKSHIVFNSIYNEIIKEFIEEEDEDEEGSVNDDDNDDDNAIIDMDDADFGMASP